MYFISTRNQTVPKTLSAAINEGLARDGGLFVPQQMPVMNPSCFSAGLSYPEFACCLLEPFFCEDALVNSLMNFCRQAFHFPVPVKKLNENTFVLELFHGPTSSFKDFGAHFLAACLNATAEGRKTIIVATSGDTGSAVASAFHGKMHYRAIILYPDGQVSAKQEHQMTCWDNNIFAFAVDANFDRCQQLVKAAFRDPSWHESGGLSSANSINIGRLLPQIAYYAYSAMGFFREYNRKPGFIIPSGNLGNATAAYWAKAMGFPLREIVLATNANRVLVDYLQTGKYQVRSSVMTIANAMDVANPSNLERLEHLFSSFQDFKQNVRAFSVKDQDIQLIIKQLYEYDGYIACPHTATGFSVRQLLDDQPWIVVATADPCKFDQLIEPIINCPVPIAPQLQQLLARPNKIRHVEANLAAIKALSE